MTTDSYIMMEEVGADLIKRAEKSTQILAMHLTDEFMPFFCDLQWMNNLILDRELKWK